MRVAMLVASLEATSGSVMAKAERISPSSSGLSQRRLASSEPKRAMVSMLPVSGAEQLKTSLAQSTRPMISASGAYSWLLRPAPAKPAACALSTGKNRFHKPAWRASGLSRSMVCSGVQRLPAAVLAAISWAMAASAGYTWASMKACRRSCKALVLSEYSKSMAGPEK